jgi:peptidoglycan/xylan/chitin deacetylase (PgdA/CDA1 family)
MSAKVSDQADVSLVIGLCFHGVGTPGPHLESDAAEYFVSRDLFLAILDAARFNPAVDLTFDDGYASDLEIVLPALLERGLCARFFPLAGRLESAGHVDAAGVRRLAQAGMSVGSHGMRHRSWRGLDDASRVEELSTARAIIAEASGQTVASAACPFGEYDRSVLTSLRDLDYTQVFTSDRRRARPGHWLQPRYSVRRDDTVDTVRDRILTARPLHERLRGAAVGRLKALR